MMLVCTPCRRIGEHYRCPICDEPACDECWAPHRVSCAEGGEDRYHELVQDRRENAWEREMEYREALRDEDAEAAMDERRMRGER